MTMKLMPSIVLAFVLISSKVKSQNAMEDEVSPQFRELVKELVHQEHQQLRVNAVYFFVYF